MNTELIKLHAAIQAFWVAQCEGHACGCDEWPECTHTLNAAMLRKEAMLLDDPPECTAPIAPRGMEMGL